jgi:hypothetical protein
MSHPLVSHSPDLSRLQEEGYDLEIRGNYLLVKHVPYATSSIEAAYGTLVSELTTTGTSTTTPGTHVAYFIGGIPCDHHGAALDNIIIGKEAVPIVDDLVAACTFSSKPTDGYANYFDKMTAYIGMLAGWAQAIDPTSTARTHPPVRMSENESVFRYLDASSSRARISHLASKLALPKVAIIGVGGTGSYILDFVAKTPVWEIHLYDGDRLYAHNAFRSPGAASAEELDEIPYKVDYFHRKYIAIHRGVIPHPTYVDDTNVDELATMSFVFLAIDSGSTKRLIVETLETADIPFIETGMGADETDNSLAGILRVTASVPGRRTHIRDNNRIAFADPPDDDYDRNIQIADLNALNALLAVLKWKKLCGFYSDYEHELTAAYVVARNRIVNDDRPS